MQTTFENLVSSFRLLDALDLLIVAFVLYRMILMIRGTRAVQLLKGVVMILLATGLAHTLHLGALSWLLDKILTIGLFAIPVVFQPELRRGLEQLGRGKFFSSRSTTLFQEEEDIPKTINELTKATGVLAKNKIGALIILERETGLSDHIETGIPIGAVVSSELLINTFIPNTPLHDGAVIIRGQNILAASCFLPLSDNALISKELGTRHRAGIGISEQSDAVAVIVSEETGAISLAADGKLTRNLDEQSFREFLTNLLVPVKTDRFTLFKGKAGS
ncbi:TIGR00159 family protein [Tumebacillus sp. ITR2]|uniref:Diadenylate cyclase n=1 Tax=Tumebacillus amylolyticus TaxID=2801339 RepID=A0ABS1J5H4_9BACL|nr:diadenylate cyclase CdaA [Tumebacillus amylolyticus]MBL0385546.1 TIGR00159 family protein [Tumebacillus amylolyticus]